MSTFQIRRNHPYQGMLTLQRVPGGGFVAKEMTISERQFWTEVKRALGFDPSAEGSEPPTESTQSGEPMPASSTGGKLRITRRAQAAAG